MVAAALAAMSVIECDNGVQMNLQPIVAAPRVLCADFPTNGRIWPTNGHFLLHGLQFAA
jgi:hypothetical protein